MAERDADLMRGKVSSEGAVEVAMAECCPDEWATCARVLGDHGFTSLPAAIGEDVKQLLCAVVSRLTRTSGEVDKVGMCVSGGRQGHVRPCGSGGAPIPRFPGWTQWMLVRCVAACVAASGDCAKGGGMGHSKPRAPPPPLPVFNRLLQHAVPSPRSASTLSCARALCGCAANGCAAGVQRGAGPPPC